MCNKGYNWMKHYDRNVIYNVSACFTCIITVSDSEMRKYCALIMVKEGGEEKEQLGLCAAVS
jgi:hypothetical protein